jgi:hypothetical protein
MRSRNGAGVWLLRLYPRAWRARYGEEFAALLAETRLSPFVVCDVLLGALDAHLRPDLAPKGVFSMASRLRTSAVTIFCAYIAFVIAGLALNGFTDDTRLVRIRDAHVELAAPWYFIMGAAVLSLLAVAAGGLPIAWSVWRNSPQQRRLLLVPVLCFIVIAIPPAIILVKVLTGAVSTAPSNTPASPTAIALVTTYGLLFVFAAVVSTWTVTAAVRRASVPVELYRFALLPATVMTAAMTGMLLATLALGFFANQDDPGEFQRIDLRLPTTFSLLTWSGVVVVMAAATVVAALALRRGYRARVEEAGRAAF